MIGPRAYRPGDPDAPPACDLQQVLDLIAAYIAPSQPLSYGRFVELLSQIRGCEGYSYSDLYPRLFNVQANPDPYPGECVVVYDCEVAASKLRAEQGLPEPRTVPDMFADVLNQLTKSDQRQIADLLGPKAWGIITAIRDSKSDREAQAMLAEIVSAVEELTPEQIDTLTEVVAPLFEERKIQGAPELVELVFRAFAQRKGTQDDVH